MSLHIPRKENISQTLPSDPVKFYYVPFVRHLFLQRLRLVLKLLGQQKVERLLEIGCGSGIFLKELSTHCQRLHALDVHEALSAVRELSHIEGFSVYLTRSSVLELPYKEDSFDVVICASVLEHLHEVSKALQEIRRILKPGGKAIIGIPVENFIVHNALKFFYHWLPGARLEDEHVSFYSEIIPLIRKHFRVQKEHRFPFFVPLSLSWYYVCEATK